MPTNNAGATPNNKASEELLAAPLPELVKNLGLAVAEANKEMRSDDGDGAVRYTIDSADITLKVAISINTAEKIGGDAGAKISVFSVNASYARTYGFNEQASSEIKLTLKAVPPVGASAAETSG